MELRVPMISKRLVSALPACLLSVLIGCGSEPSSSDGPGGAPAVAGGSGVAGGGASSTAGVASGGRASAGGDSGVSANGGELTNAAGSANVSGASNGGGGIANAGSGGTGVGAAGTAGSGTAGSATTVGIPAGYPASTPENAAKCQTVPMKSGFCPGGGAGPVCMQCLFGGEAYGTSETTPTAEGTALAGNYLVTVKLSGASTFVSAESSRGLLKASPAGDYAFVVNVRAMEGQPGHSGGPSGYPGLDLFFSGTSATPPLVNAIGYGLATPATKPIMVYIASDSTTCDQTGNEFAGWGQMLPQHFLPPVGIANYANSGASSGGFGFWKDITSRWSAGDYVILQFGHNDKTQTDAQVQANLEKYASDSLAANVNPIIVSPPARAQFTGSTLSSQGGLHAAAAKAAAAAKKVPYIDLTSLSTAWYNTLGSQAAALKFHANGSDATHTNLAGADKLAELVAADIKAQNLALAKYLRP